MIQMRLTISLLIINFFITHKAHSIIYDYQFIDRSLEHHAETLDDKHLGLAANTAFDAVGKLVLSFYSEEKNNLIHVYCTGTLISPHSVITTADCIAPLIADNSYTIQYARDDQDNTFTLGNDLYNAPFAKAKVIGASYFEGFEAGIHDMDAQNLAVLFLDAPIRNIKPAKLYGQNQKKGQKNVDFYKKPVVMVGFGFRGDPVRGILEPLDDRKRACNQRIVAHKRSMYLTKFEVGGQELQGMFTHGDQGGPMFVQEDNEWYVAGINDFRAVPEYEKNNPKVKEDPRFIPYGTVGYSIAIPPYFKWIEKNSGIKKVKREDNWDETEWSFRPYWNNYQIPNNGVGKYFKVEIGKPGRILINNFYDLEKIILDHEHAEIILPPAAPTILTEDDAEKAIGELITDKRNFEALELRRTLFKPTKKSHEKNSDNDKLFRLLQLKSHYITIKQGTFRVDGELAVEQLKIQGGTLKGYGEIMNTTVPVINSGGTIEPFHPKKVGKLTIWGDYTQLDQNSDIAGGTLSIRVHKYVAKNSKLGIKMERIRNDVLAVKGHITLGGTLILKETNRHVKPNDEVIVAHGNNLKGRFARIIGPDHVDLVAHYGPSEVKIQFKEKPPIHAHLNQGRQLLLTGPAHYLSLDINGGELFADSEISLSEGILKLSSGSIKMNNPKIAKELIINGNYEQHGGTLSLKLVKTLVETQRPESTPEGVSPGVNLSFDYKNDHLKINGHAKLGGTVAFLFDEDPIVKNGSKFKIIEARSIEGRFEGIEHIPRNLRPSFIYTPTTVEVVFEAGHFSDIAMNDSRAQKAAKILDDVRGTEAGKKFELLYKRLDSMPQEDMEAFLLNNIIKTVAFKRLMQ